MPEPSLNPESASASVDSLQFQTADIIEKKRTCSQCTALLGDDYYQLAGADICPACAVSFQTGQQRPKQTWVMRGFLYGLAAAVGCSILYSAIVWITNFELALMAIAVGYIVGKGVLRGSRGLGGRRCQIVAVALTYFSISSSYLPLMVKALMENESSKTKKQEQGKQASTVAPVTPVKKVDAKPLTAAGAALAIGTILLISMFAPFLQLADGFNGILGLFIICIGLHQAWKLTARDERLLMGPYKREGTESDGATA